MWNRLNFELRNCDCVKLYLCATFFFFLHQLHLNKFLTRSEGRRIMKSNSKKKKNIKLISFIIPHFEHDSTTLKRIFIHVNGKVPIKLSIIATRSFSMWRWIKKIASFKASSRKYNLNRKIKYNLTALQCWLLNLIACIIFVKTTTA